MHVVKFLKGKSYENETACRNFIQNAAEYLFQRANFISLLSDESTDAAIFEKGCIYILFVDPDEFNPNVALCSKRTDLSRCR